MSALLVKFYWWSYDYFRRSFGCTIDDYIKEKGLHVIAKYLKDRKTLLDAACGSDNLFLKEMDLSNVKTTGLDIDPNVRESNKLHDKIIIEDLHNFRTDEKFDGIFSLFTWEHLHSPEKVLRNFNDALSSNGILIIVASNAWSYTSIIERLLPRAAKNLVWRILKGRKEMPYPAFYRLCSKSSLIAEARQAGFTNVHYETFEMPPMWFMGLPPVFVIMCSFMRLLNRHLIFQNIRSTFIAVFQKT